MWVKGVLSLTELQNSPVILLLFSDTGTDLGSNSLVSCNWPCFSGSPHDQGHFENFKFLFIVFPRVM